MKGDILYLLPTCDIECLLYLSIKQYRSVLRTSTSKLLILYDENNIEFEKRVKQYCDGEVICLGVDNDDHARKLNIGTHKYINDFSKICILGTDMFFKTPIVDTIRNNKLGGMRRKGWGNEYSKKHNIEAIHSCFYYVDTSVLLKVSAIDKNTGRWIFSNNPIYTNVDTNYKKLPCLQTCDHLTLYLQSKEKIHTEFLDDFIHFGGLSNCLGMFSDALGKKEQSLEDFGHRGIFLLSSHKIISDKYNLPYDKEHEKKYNWNFLSKKLTGKYLDGYNESVTVTNELFSQDWV